MNEMVEWAPESGKSMVNFWLDFDFKAFDRVNLHSLKERFERWTFVTNGFAGQYVYSNASSKVTVNIELSGSSSISKSMRQECPLVPYLYIATTEILHYMLQKKKL